MLAERARVLASVVVALAYSTMCSVYDSSVFGKNSTHGGDAGTGTAGSVAAGGSDAGNAGVDASAGASASAGTSSGGETAGGTAGASSATGGSSGSTGGASPGNPPPIFNGNLELIDDLEDGDIYLYLFGTDRDGKWWLGFDGTAGTTEPNPFSPDDAGGYDGSSAATHLKMSGYTNWGSNAGFNFMHEVPPKSWPAPYDASAYCGVAFWAKRSETSDVSFDVRVSDANTHPAGGVCSDDPDAGTDDAGNAIGCFDHFYKTVTLTTEWAYYELLFSDLQQSTWGYLVDGGLTASQLYGFELTFGGNKTFEIWIDDVAFVLREDGGACP